MAAHEIDMAMFKKSNSEYVLGQNRTGGAGRSAAGQNCAVLCWAPQDRAGQP